MAQTQNQTQGGQQGSNIKKPDKEQAKHGAGLPAQQNQDPDCRAGPHNSQQDDPKNN
jgi:hypothetical protein